jgi:hypothetical protein
MSHSKAHHRTTILLRSIAAGEMFIKAKTNKALNTGEPVSLGVGAKANKMKTTRHLALWFILIIMMVGCISKEPSPSFDSVNSVERAIKSGELGADFAARAKKTGDLYVNEVANPGIPYKIYTFSDFQAGYTVMVEDKHLILLCAGFSGGFARDFMMKKEKGKEVLSYHFDVGSGLRYELSGRYVLGSGRATLDTWDKIKPRQ